MPILQATRAYHLVDSSGCRNTSMEAVAMGVRRRRSDRSGRGALPSPGRPSVARREDHRRFWTAIAAGRSSEEAAVGVGVAPVLGPRWFRQAGGMPPSHLSPSSRPLSGRYLSFADREEIALGRAGARRARDRPSPGPCPVHDLARATPPRAAAAWSIEPQPRRGTPIVPPGVRSWRSSRATQPSSGMCRSGWPASSWRRTGRRFPGPP